MPAICFNNPVSNKNNLNWSNLSKAESGCSSLETLYIRFSIPAETSHSIASSKSLALAPSLTAPYMNFSFDFASCVTILRKTIRIRPLFTLPLCLEKSFSYTSISSRWIWAILAGSLCFNQEETHSGIPPMIR